MPKIPSLRFSLRSLLIAVAVVAVLLAYPAYRAQRQAALVDAVWRDGGRVIYSNEWLPEFLFFLIPADFHSSPSYVTFDHQEREEGEQHTITEAQLRAVANLPHLRTIDFSNADIDDDDIQFIYKMTKIESLSFLNTNVSLEECEKIQEHFPYAAITYNQ